MGAILYPKLLEKRWADEKAEAEYKAETERLYHQYYEDHAVCPECGSNDMEVTTAPFGPSINQRRVSDTNRASCAKCKWRGIVDDMISKEQFVNQTKIVYDIVEKDGKTRCVCSQLDPEEKE